MSPGLITDLARATEEETAARSQVPLHSTCPSQGPGSDIANGWAAMGVRNLFLALVGNWQKPRITLSTILVAP